MAPVEFEVAETAKGATPYALFAMVAKLRVGVAAATLNLIVATPAA
jgi:hypothetical protein